MKMALSYSFSKAIIFFNISSDEMDKLAQSKFRNSGGHQYLFWLMNYSEGDYFVQFPFVFGHVQPVAQSSFSYHHASS